ncbi:MAG: carboxypeptidase-like regulatory domain-containing protein [Myxococcota bacterium]
MQNTFKSLLTLALALAVAAPASAANHFIAGRVIDRNGDPIDQAVVTLKPIDETSNPINVQLVTDREGRFLIDYLRDPEGERAKLAKRVDYTVEVYKPGFHAREVSFYYKKGEMQIDTLMMSEDTIVVHDDKADLDPDAYDQRTHSSGANYEGQ